VRVAIGEIALIWGPITKGCDSRNSDLQFFEHPPDVAILAFVQHNFEPRMALALRKHADVFYAQEFAVVRADSVSQCPPATFHRQWR